MTPITAPTIARLKGRPRKWAYRRMKAGRYGPVIHRRGRWQYVALEAVEAAEGMTFPADRLRAVGIYIQEAEHGR